MQPTESQMSNILQGQKDVLWQAVSNLEAQCHERRLFLSELQEVNKLIDTLVLLQPLWNAFGYGYKGREICTMFLRIVADQAEKFDNRQQGCLAELGKMDRLGKIHKEFSTQI